MERETICFLNGCTISLDEAVKRVKNGIENESDLLQVDEEEYIDVDEIYRCINHSCNPNCFIRGRNELVSLKDIAAGEEITFDYSTTMWEDKEKYKKLFDKEVWTMVCSCGNENCRKVVTQFYELPNEILIFYLKNRFLPDFILKKHALKKLVYIK